MADSNPKTHPFWDLWGPIIFTLSVYAGVRHYLAEARYIPSGSMLPALQIQDRLLVEKISFRRRSPGRGEIVVFNSPYSFDQELRSGPDPSPWRCLVVNLPLANFIPGLAHAACDAYIKRVVAVAGDQVLINPKGEVTLNGAKSNESYVANYCLLDKHGISHCPALNLKVPSGHVLVLGDNRRNSWDSRFWPGGPFLPETEIIGRAVWRFWPIGRLGSVSL